MVRGAAAAGAMVVYPLVFEWACVAGNLLTHALLDAPGVRDGHHQAAGGGAGGELRAAGGRA